VTLEFSARIDGALIRCEVTSDQPVIAPVFCFSLMAPARVVAGGTLIRQVAGYSEVRLPDLAPGQPAQIVLSHANPDFRPANRAWLPLGGYLRHADGIDILPPLPAGVTPTLPRPAPPFAGLRLIPQPTEWQSHGGTLAVSQFAGDAAPLLAVDALARRSGLGEFLAPNGTPLTLHDDPAQPDEGYRLTLSPDGAQLSASGRAGYFYGAITLLNLRSTYAGALPCGTIIDAPRFGWRGQHLDCARHYYQPATLHRLLDLMALLKLNRFHWHFADDEAFRLEVDCLPDLWQKTAFRGEGELVPGVFGGGVRAGGSYSKPAARALIDHAAELCIEVMPEIEVPAHSYALNLALPGLRDRADNGAGVSIQGYLDNAVNPAQPRTWDVLAALTGEIAAMFPFAHLHLGCDELAPETWTGSPDVTALKTREGLATDDDVQGWMMERLAGLVAANGIRPAAWEEAAKGRNGGIGNGALLFSWTGQGPGVAAARAGYDVVMCPAQHSYFDMAHTADPADWGASWAAFIGLEQTVDWTPVPPEAADVAGHIVGVQGCYWSEFTTADAQIEPMIAPRILGLANKAWDSADTVDGAALRALAGHYRVVFDQIGWAPHGAA
jgi:hexosaminidase